MRRERAVELRKAAAALRIAAEAAVADADAAAVVKQCLEVHAIDQAAISKQRQACGECRRLHQELLKLCTKLGLPAPPGAPTAATTIAIAAAASAPSPEATTVQLQLLAV